MCAPYGVIWSSYYHWLTVVIFDLEGEAAPGERRTEDRLAVKLDHRSPRAGRVWVCYAGCFALALGLVGPSGFGGFLCVL